MVTFLASFIVLTGDLSLENQAASIVNEVMKLNQGASLSSLREGIAATSFPLSTDMSFSADDVVRQLPPLEKSKTWN